MKKIIALSLVLLGLAGFGLIGLGAYFVTTPQQWVVPNQDMVLITLGACAVGLVILIVSQDK
ncbi:hypothetical protein [Burkholderia phage vB_BpP_HN01]|uniref:Uncharacterized protein n=1 Tax=Burkholderia phage vB_BpP_HN02 TaxID=3116925 RepID=A0AAX4JGW9_9CAUD|nr:hypothetical protein [Burkholderia phage vB_BpP_HN01]